MSRGEKEGNYNVEQVASIVATHDLDAWKAFVASVLRNAVPCDASKALIACAVRCLKEAACNNLCFAINAGKVLLTSAAHLGATWGAVFFDVRGALAEWCVQAGDEEGARELWHAMLPADDDQTSLKLLTNILNSALRTRTYGAAETKCLRGLVLYNTLSARPEANEVANEFLQSFASLMVARQRFLEASRRLYDLYTRTKSLSHLSVAAVCAIRADAGASRSQFLAVLYKDENAAQLGDLYTILAKAHNLHILRPSDFQGFIRYVEPPFDDAAIKNAFIQHNIQAISRLYCNIGFASLGALLCIDATEAEKIVAQMVSERRLDAILDQTMEVVIFDQTGGESMLLKAWDARINSLCEQLSHVADLISDCKV